MLTALTLLLLFAGPASEARVEVQAEGAAAEHAERVRKAVESGLKRAGVTVDESASIGVRVTVTATGADISIALAARSGEAVLAETDGLCEICGGSEIDALAGDLAGRMAERLTSLNDTGTLRVDGSPANAVVWLDGEKFGSVPTELALPAGDHVVEIKARGHLPEQYEWSSVPGVTEAFRFSLRPEAKDDPGIQPKGRRTLRLTGWAALGTGIAGVATGGALVGIHGVEHQGSCTPESVDVNGLCPNSYNTQLGGIIGLAVGGAALAASIPLLVIGHGAGRKQVALGARANGFWVAGRF